MEGEEQYSLWLQGNVTQGWRSQGMLLLSFPQHIFRKCKSDFFSWVPIFPFQLRASPGPLGLPAFIAGKHQRKGERKAVLKVCSKEAAECCQGKQLLQVV